ncbi:Dynein heavy chain family protein [Tritrichomonas foetus]|uniref:Dynein heavy chain family protein n=1 Tax=Tritrichomonas foetus TaxID=1144522 RepID=A0A1J4JNS9_9EUKA|nr:Dynein heavy chain family protein [Tritrichomonas foetus]|eukprot:OHT00707.1 Dynein heavy chain family protein [Tritrichomonas foetus]
MFKIEALKNELQMSNPNHSSMPNRRSRDLMNRLIPKQKIHNHPVTLGVTMGKNTKPIIRSSALGNPKVKKLPPLPDPEITKENNIEIDPDEPLPEIDYETLTDPFDFIQKAKERNDYRSYVYLHPSDILEDSEHPTCLRIIPQSQSSREEFWNLSLNGLTHVKSSAVDFIPLDDWLHDITLFSKIMHIPFFKNQRLWRTFKLWKKAIQSDKMNSARTALTTDLFFSHSVLRPAFIQIQRELNKLQQIKLFSVRPDGLYTLESLSEENLKHRENVTKIFDDFFTKTLQVVQDACEKTIDKLNSGEENHHTQEKTNNEASILDQWIAQYNRAQKHGANTQFDNNNGPSLTFTKKASHHAVCQKLVRFIRLVDYVVISSLRHICFTSLLELYSIILTLHDRGVKKLNYEDPSPIEEINLPNEFQKIYKIIHQKTGEIFELPIFRIDVSFSQNMNWKPTEKEIVTRIETVRNEFIDLLFKVPRLVVNPIFRQYIANDISTERNGQDKMSTPDLGQIIFNDPIYKETMKKEAEVISHSFGLLGFYSHEFQKAIDIYEENCRFDITFLDSHEITASHVKEKIKEYHEQEVFLRTIVDKSEVGLFHIFMNQMKALFIKSPGNCLQQIRQRLPLVTHRFLQEFSEKVTNAHVELTATIDDVASFVEYIHAVSRQSEALPELQRLSDVIRGFQQLASEQGVFLSSEEQLEFQELLPVFDEVKRCLAFAEEQKAALQPKFASILEKSIAQLHSNVLEVASMANNPLLSKSRTSPNQAATILAVVIAKTDELNYLAKNYNHYQSSMNLAKTKFDDVHELVADVALKQLLWETKTEWTNVTQQWFEQPFQAIDPPEMIGQLSDFQERSTRAQLGFPNNEVADELCASIQDFSNLLPIVTNLKNPALNQTHMDQITSLLGGEIFGNEEFKLGRLVDLHAFNYVEQISAISAQATNEQSLQDQLNRVRNIIDSLKYEVNPCKFQKSCYVIEGDESILANLDDAQTTINSVRSSKYIAPLRSKADELMKSIRSILNVVNLLSRVQNNWSFISVIFQAGDIARQLQNDAKDLQSVDKTWKIVSSKLNDDPSMFFKLSNANIGSQTIPDLENAALLLDKIRKSVDDFIEQKRITFPRLYFISNSELLDMISKSKDPNCIQPYLPKLFDGIFTIETGLENHVPAAIALITLNGERLNLRPIKFRNNIEVWLANIEEQSIRTLKTEMKNARSKFQEMVREDWISIQPSQIAYAITQTEWSSRVDFAFNAANPLQALTDLYNEIEHKIANLVKLTHLDLRESERCKISSAILLDSHFRDMVKDLIDNNIADQNNYHYLKNFLLKWEDNAKEIIVTLFDSTYKYGYEFIGSQTRLIITPQYINTLSSLSITLSKHYGGSLIGPSGSGKTETIRDIAKSMGTYCYLLNCSPSITTLQLASIIRGVVQSGVWCCLQELQRLPDETQNVADWHLNIVRQATIGGLKKFLFDTYEIPLSQTYCVYSTVSSIQSSAIPEKLKNYFRPVSFESINESKIVELTLLTLGFQEAQKITKNLLRLTECCRNILVKQKHYDLNIRILKMIINNAGSLLHDDSVTTEESVIKRSILNILIPTLNSNDQSIVTNLVNEFFPCEPVQSNDFADIDSVIKDICQKNHLQPTQYTLLKVEQLHRMSRSSPSIMLVGQSGSGKTTTLNLLQNCYDELNQTKDDEYFSVNRSIICPSTLTFEELYGFQNLETGEFKLGMIETLFDSKANNNLQNKEEWLIFDGPIRQNWIENLNTLLDGNQTLSLPNAKFIKLTKNMHVFFEVPDLSNASPSTLSRSSIIYFETSKLGWKPLAQSLCEQKVFPLFQEKQPFIDKFKELINNSISAGIEFLTENGDPCFWSPLSCTENLIKIIVSLIHGKQYKEGTGESIICSIYIFAFTWAFGGNLKYSRRVLFDSFVRDIFGGFTTLPNRGMIFDWTVDNETGVWSQWSDHLPKFIDTAPDDFDLNPSNSALYCHTVETYKISYILKLLIKSKINVILHGQSGIGKSSVIKETLKELMQNSEFGAFNISFTSKTTSQIAQKLIELFLERKHGEYLRPICNKHSVLCIDNINQGKSDSIDLLRQILSLKGLISKPTYKWMEVKKLSLLGVAGNGNGTKDNLPQRFLRHALMLEMMSFDNGTSYHIIHSILQLFFRRFDDQIRNVEPHLSNTLLTIYESVCAAFPLSISHPQYCFSFRDVIRVIRGLLRVSPDTVSDIKKLERLFVHEVNRAFCDRFNDMADVKRFEEIVTTTVKKKMNSDQPSDAFGTIFAEIVNDPTEYTDDGFKKHRYNEYDSIDLLTNDLDDPAHEYQYSSKNNTPTLPLLLFDFCSQHVSRLLRIIRTRCDHAVLLGKPGTGKRTVARFTAFLTKSDVIEFDNLHTLHEDFKSICLRVGINNKSTVLIIGDEQMKNDQFMDDLSSLMSGGDITSLFSRDDIDKICADAVFFAKSSGEDESHQNLTKLFLDRLRNSIHVVLCASPDDFNMKDRFINYQSLLHYSTIDYYKPWPDTAFTKLATSQFDDNKISELTVSIHQSVCEVSQKMLNQYGRNYFITPALFIHFITNYKRVSQSRKSALEKKIENIESSLKKITFTDSSIGSMESNLTDIEPQLREKTQQADLLSHEIGETQTLYDQLSSTISEMEKKVQEKVDTVQKIQDEAAQELAEVQPALEKAIAALKGLNRGDITELRSFQDPPPPVKTVMEVICIFAEADINWKAACNILADPLFINKISNKFNENRHVSSTIMKKVQPYIETNPNFQESEVGRVSVAAKCLCVWGTSLYNYEMAYRKVEPKQQQIKTVNASLKKAKDKLKKKLAQAKSMEDQLDELKQKYDLVNREKRRLNDSINESKSRVGHASKLAQILALDQRRWADQSQKLKDSQQYTQGDSFICAAFITYFGPLPPSLRNELFSHIMKKVNDAQMKTTPGFTITRIMADPSEIQEWLNNGLPDDSTSIENAIIMRDSVMSPLIIDPLGFANQLIKSFEKVRQLVTFKPNHPNFHKTIESSMRLGIPVLLEDIGETLDPSIENVIAHRVINQDGKKLIKLNERSIEFDDKFKLYITTKIAEPAYSPEAYTTASIIDFSITKAALVAHETSNIVEIDDPELEKNKKSTVAAIVAAKSNLKQTEERMLELLRTSGDHILDDEVLINTIESSENKRREIEESLFKLETENEKYTKERIKLVPVAERIAVIFLSLSPLANLNPLYSYSLSFIECVALNAIKQIINKNSENSDKSMGNSSNVSNDSKEKNSQSESKNIEVTSGRNQSEKDDNNEKIVHFINFITLSLYQEISRSLLKTDRLTLSFIIAAAILRDEKKISETEWGIFSRGLPKIPNPIDNPVPSIISQELWDNVNSLSRSVSNFRSLPNKILSDHQQFTDFINSNSYEIPEIFGSKLDDLQKLLFIKTISPHKLPYFVKMFVNKNLGLDYTKQITPHLSIAHKLSSPNSPILLLLATPNIDARQNVLYLAHKMQMDEKIKVRAMSITESLKVEKELHLAATRGEWIFLEKIENSGKFIEELYTTIIKVCSGSIHPDFRIFLSTHINSKLPPDITFNSVKMIIENADSIRLNALSHLSHLPEDFFANETSLRMSFTLTMYHCIVSSRQKFGIAGFNCPYDFNDSDFQLVTNVIHPFLSNDPNFIPYEYISYLIGNLIYGGHSNDQIDKKIISSMLSRIFSKEAITNIYEPQQENQSPGQSVTYANGPLFVLPKVTNKRKLFNFLQSLPETDSPSIYGLNENLRSSHEIQLSLMVNKSIRKALCNRKLFDDIIHEIVIEKIKVIQTSIPTLEDIESEIEEIVNLSDPLTIVLKHETRILQQAMNIAKTSMNNIEKVIHGLMKSTKKIKQSILAIYKDQVPKNWQTFICFMTLDTWVKEINKRVEFFNTWIRRGKPVLFDLSCFEDPKQLLLAIVSHHVKSNQIPLSEISYTVFGDIPFEVRVITDENEPEKAPETGAFIKGLAFTGAKFDTEHKLLVEQGIDEKEISICPILHIVPVIMEGASLQTGNGFYQCPIYQISENPNKLCRKKNTGELITILPIPTNQTEDFWILRGASLHLMIG